MSFAAREMELENIILTEISQKQKDKIPHVLPYRWELRTTITKQTNKQKTPIFTHFNLNKEW